ncbi:hypothetical protein J4467_02500 [Candidatus Woesearchaeota archaeon]|nr:hypothetical protein [Candidatus Woesearchaeota archaeon]
MNAEQVTPEKFTNGLLEDLLEKYTTNQPMPETTMKTISNFKHTHYPNLSMDNKFYEKIKIEFLKQRTLLEDMGYIVEDNGSFKLP